MMTTWLSLMTILLLGPLEEYCMEVAHSARLPDIYWNASNPIFRIDNTDHIFDVNRGNNKFEYDQVNLICPLYPKGTKEEDAESYIIYNVSKEEYDSCSISSTSTARIIAVCDKPHQLMYFTITFRSFTPQPGGLEFKPGQDYYFMTTSTGRPEGLGKRFGGRCASRHMKVVFKVCCSNDSSQNTPPEPNLISSNVTTQHPAVHHFHPHPVSPSSPSSNATFAMRPTPGVLNSTTAIRSSKPSAASVSGPVVPSSTRSTPGVVAELQPVPVVRGPSATRAPSLSSAVPPTPFWWRPQTKVTIPKNNQSQDAIPGESESSSGPNGRRGRAWLLVVAAGIAVGVACLIVCGLGLGRRFLVIQKTPKETMIHTINPRLYDMGPPC